MKREFILMILTGLIITLLLSSCSKGGPQMFSRLFDDDKEVAHARMDKVLEIIKNKDKDALKAIFSKKSISEIENFDKSITDLFDYFQGDFMSYNGWTGPAAFEEKDNGQRKKQLDSSCDVETSEQKYRLAIQDIIVDTANPDNVGIWSIYIIKLEDDTDSQFSYWGDGKDTPGINIGIKNVLSDEEE